MDIATLLFFAAALMVAAGSPGPSIAALVARVLARGHRDVWPFLAAMWLGEIAWLSLAVWGLSALAASFAAVFVALKWIGVGYLLWLAWKMWRAPVGEIGDLPTARSPWRMFAAGLAVTFGNPKIMMFYVALVPGFLDLAHIGVTAWAELAVTAVTVLVMVDAAWVLAATHARRLLTGPRARRIANRCSAGLMAGAATAIAARG